MNLHKRTHREPDLIELFHRRFGSHWHVWVEDGVLYYRNPEHAEPLTSQFMDTTDDATRYFTDFFKQHPDIDARTNR